MICKSQGNRDSITARCEPISIQCEDNSCGGVSVAQQTFFGRWAYENQNRGVLLEGKYGLLIFVWRGLTKLQSANSEKRSEKKLIGYRRNRFLNKESKQSDHGLQIRRG